MKFRAVLPPCVLVLAGCAASRLSLPTPLDVAGIISKPRYTGWQVDHCDGGQAVNPPTACLRPDGDIYRIELREVRTRDGKPIAGRLTAGYPGRALPEDYRATRLLRLVKSSDSLREETGIEYIASDLGAATPDP
jgi:hypothetical protein